MTDRKFPVKQMIAELDALFARNDLDVAGELLERSLNEAISLRDPSGELSILNELTGYYRKRLNRERALEVIDRALFLVDELGQGNKPSGATVLLNCATTLKTFGKADRALPLYSRAEEIYLATLEKNDPRFAALYNNRALSLCDLGRYREAEESYLSALEVLSDSGLDAAITHVNLAELYLAAGREGEIGERMTRALDILLDPEIPHDGYYAFVLEKCAPAFRGLGYVEVSDELKRVSEDIYASH